MHLPSRSAALLVGAMALLLPVGAAAQSALPAASPAPSPTPSIEKVNWVLDSWAAAGATQPTVAGSFPSLWFDGLRVTGSTGCNPIHGTYTVTGTTLAVAALGPMTAMCIQGLDAQQQAVLAGLTGSPTIQLGAGTLALLDAKGAVQLTYHEAPAIEGRAWVLATPGGQPAPQQSPTITFQGGTLTGQGPCNSYSATYALDGSTLTIGQVTSTQMACADLALETAYFAALSSATNWSIDASGDLVLADASGKEVLRFVVPHTDD